MSDFYPIMLKVGGERCVVVGGGKVAERKTKMLLECNASVCVISPHLTYKLGLLLEEGHIQNLARDYCPGDLDGALLAVAATDDPEINEQICREGREKGVLVNIVDDLENSGFILPSVLRRGDVVIAISTSGRSPALSRKIRTVLEESYGIDYASLALLLSEVRTELKERGVHVDSDAWQESLNIELLLDLLRRGESGEAKRRLLSDLENSDRKSRQ
jgi:siroheme synthase-like protein